VAVVAEKLYSGSLGRPAGNFALLDKIRTFAYHIYSLSIFSLGCIKIPWGDASKFGIVFTAFIVDETSGYIFRES